MSEPNDWHRHFGVILQDFFTGTDVKVELEKDLSLKQQLLDVVIITAEQEPSVSYALPDGFEPLAPHNLITFKSYRESLDAWAISELIGHYVNYRKQVSPSMQNLLPTTDFRLYAVCARMPRNLDRIAVLESVQPGVFNLETIVGQIRIIVANELPQRSNNALLHLFSARGELIEYGASQYQLRSKETTTFLLELLYLYNVENATMPETLEEYKARRFQELIQWIPARIRLEGLSPQERLEGLAPQERLQGLAPQERLEGLAPEEKRKLLQHLLNEAGKSQEQE